MIQNGFTNLTPDEFRSYLQSRDPESYTLVDVRHPMEYESGHIEGAMLVPIWEFESKLAEMPADRDLAIYCKAGLRSRMASVMAAESGRFEHDIINLKGGYLTYVGKPLPAYPRLRDLAPGLSTDKNLGKALQLAKGAWQFYEVFRIMTPRDSLGPHIDRVLTAKREQAAELHRVYQAETGENLPPEDQYFKSLKADILQSGDEMEKLLEWVQEVAGDCPQLAVLTFDFETRAYELYRTLSRQCTGHEGREAFPRLIQEEKDIVALVASNIHHFIG
jgi:rhodanese-related sulfurtransferase